MLVMNFVLLFIYLGVHLHFNNAISVKLVPEYFWDAHRGRVVECDIPCEFSEEPENVDAEFYIAMNDGDVKRAAESESDTPIKILGSQEGAHYYHLLKGEFLKRHFQGTSLLDRRSDIPWVIMPNMDEVKKVEKPKYAKPNATFVSRNCNSMNKRNDYVAAINEVIGVFAPSSCFHNMDWPQCEGRECTKVEVIRDYKINLAFENGDSPGYITEKIYHSMEAGVLPVYMGTVGVAYAVPRSSYIDVAEFDTPHDAANYLKMVLENETLYNSYFEWKHKPFNPEFEVANRVLWEVSHYCRVCYYVDAIQRGAKWDHLHQRASDRIPGNLKVSEEKASEPEETVRTAEIGTIEEIKSENEITASNRLNLVNTPKRNPPNFEVTSTFHFSLLWTVLSVLICLLFIMCKEVLKKFIFWLYNCHEVH